MPAEDVNAKVETLEGEEDQKREQSTIAFPYMDLDDAISIARGIHETTGASPCQHDQLAAAVQQSMNSSGYRMRVSAARLFGLVESDRGGGLRLTALGQMIVDAARAREAKVKAFLAVPLYNKLHEHYRGKVLPPTAALTREITLLGVAQKQSDRARQTFERSAGTAGFFEMGRDRLVMLGGISASERPAGEEKPKENDSKDTGGGTTPPTRHPFIEGLLRTLPEPETEWPATARAKWLQTAANIFDLIYKGDGGIKIEAALAQRSPRPGEQ